MAITYQPQYRLHGTTSWVNWGAAISGTSTTIGNSTTPLTAGTQYDVQVIAINAFGSTTSNLVSATTTAAVTISSIVLSGSKAFTTGTNNAVVGTIAVTLSSGTFSGTLSLSGADAASFQIVNVSGTNTLETNGALSTAKTYTVNIVAAQPGASNTPFTSAAQSIIGSAPVTTTLTAPTQASAAGFSNLVFNDDFVTNTLAPAVNTPYSSSFNWYWSINGLPGGASINPTATAATINNGNSGAGANASPNGGILTVLTNKDGLNATAVLASIQGTTNILPTNGQGNWKHGYFEAYIQTKVNSPVNIGWGGFWSWSTEGMGQGGFGYASTLSGPSTEIDFMEFPGLNFPGGFTIHTPGGGTNTGSAGHTYDNNWHTIGCLWTGDGTTGALRFYWDNVLAGGPFLTGAGNPSFNLEGNHQFLALSCANNWPFNVDWVRVWQ